MMQCNKLQRWVIEQKQRPHLVGVKLAAIDRLFFLQELHQWASEQNLPVYFWNPGYGCSIQQVKLSDDNCSPILIRSEWQCSPEIVPSIVELASKGIFVLEGVLQNMTCQLNFELQNAHFELAQRRTEQFLILADELIEMPLNLYPFIPVLEYSFPNNFEIRTVINEFCQQHISFNESTIDAQRSLVRACVGLPRGEIDLVLPRALVAGASLELMAEFVMEYKRQKLQGRGLQIIPDPEVSLAAGIDLFDETLEKMRKLFEPEAKQRHLRPPKAMLLWGIPGTGKSLGAALAAKKIGATLVACDWNGLLASTVRESLANLEYVFKFLSQIGNAIFFIDEFEKAFAGWNSGSESGVMAKMAGRLLTWMQNHTEPVTMVATINRLEMLPAEIVRRFEIIHFFDLPHAGALYEVFQVHLSRYFPTYSFSEDEWRIVLREYKGCTPAEIAVAVRHVADEIYCAGREPIVTLQDLILERQNFKPASATQIISNQMAAIAQHADFAKPVSSPDTSVFARPGRLMFQTKKGSPSPPPQQTHSAIRVSRLPAPVEDI